MAYTTDRTWVAGEVATAAYFNTYLRDNVKWLSTDKPMCRAYASAVVAHTSSGNYQALTFNTNLFDNASMHSTVSNTDRFTVPSGAAGKWLFGGFIGWAVSGAGARYTSAFVNGSTIYSETYSLGDAALFVSQNITTMYSMTAAQYFGLYGWQSSGGSLNMNAYSNAWAMWVGI